MAGASLQDLLPDDQQKAGPRFATTEWVLEQTWKEAAARWTYEWGGSFLLRYEILSTQEQHRKAQAVPFRTRCAKFAGSVRQQPGLRVLEFCINATEWMNITCWPFCSPEVEVADVSAA